MQQQHRVEQYDEKLNQMKEQIGKVEEEKGRAFNELKGMKKVAEETNLMIDEVLATRRISEPHSESNSSNQSISNAREEMGTKDNNIESLKHERKQELEHQLAEQDVLLEKLKKEMADRRSSEAHAMGLLSDYKRQLQDLETELDKRKESETNLFDMLVMQTKQLEQSKILLGETKLEIASLEEKIKALQGCATQNTKIPAESQSGLGDGPSTKENAKDMEAEVELETKKMIGAQEGEELHSVEVYPKALLEEMSVLKNELKLATVAEENSKKAMDDLAFALKEVATEANQVKAKLTLSQVELEHTKGDAERWRVMLVSTEDKYKELLDAVRKEADRYKNTAERLRLEAEESLLAWNGKETEFVHCIRRAEEERLTAQKETARVLELLGEAENKIKVSKEENQKLRDILKQALNEANVAKEAAEIAKAENSQLQDSLAGKEDALSLLAQENEMLKIHEAASSENIKELRRLLSETSMKELKYEDVEKPSAKEAGKEDKESGRNAKAHNSADREHKDVKNLSKSFSLNLKDMIIPHKQHKVGNEEANKETYDDTLRGSIFDEVDSSDSDSHHDGEIGISDDFDHLDESHFDDTENDRNSRKRRALLRRFGDLIRRRGYPRKEPSNEEHLQT